MKQKARKDPPRRSKNLPHLNFEDERCKHSIFAKEQSWVLLEIKKDSFQRLKSLFLGKDKLEYGTEFFNHSKTVENWESHIKAARGFLLLCGQVQQFNCE